MQQKTLWTETGVKNLIKTTNHCASHGPVLFLSLSLETLLVQSGRQSEEGGKTVYFMRHKGERPLEFSAYNTFYSTKYIIPEEIFFYVSQNGYVSLVLLPDFHRALETYAYKTHVCQDPYIYYTPIDPHHDGPDTKHATQSFLSDVHASFHSPL